MPIAPSREQAPVKSKIPLEFLEFPFSNVSLIREEGPRSLPCRAEEADQLGHREDAGVLALASLDTRGPLAFSSGAVIGALGGLIGLGGAEFRLRHAD